MTRRLCWLKLGLLALGATIASIPPNAGAASVAVTVGDNFFSPTSTNISTGDMVVWTWSATENNMHSTTSDSAVWDSGTHTKPFSFSFTFPNAGTFPYHCTVHSGVQLGTITVSGNTPPTVSITSPAGGSVFSALAGFTIAATASDSGGSVTNVQFRQVFNGGAATVLTNDPSAPYNVGVSNLAAGAYTFSAIASDNLGAKSTNSISITVNALPTVALTNPANGGVFSAPAKLTLMASAADSDGSVTNVQFLQNNVAFTNRTSAPFTGTLSNLSAGSYNLSAIATDNRGGKATNTISVNVVNATAIVLSGPQRGGTSFQFNYTADVGLSYVVEESASIGSWNPLVTNVAATSSVTFVRTNAPQTPRYYRVGRLPNP